MQLTSQDQNLQLHHQYNKIRAPLYHYHKVLTVERFDEFDEWLPVNLISYNFFPPHSYLNPATPHGSGWDRLMMCCHGQLYEAYN